MSNNNLMIFLVRFPRLLKSLTSRNVHPAFWRRSFPVLLSSTLQSSHFTHSPMQVIFVIKILTFSSALTQYNGSFIDGSYYTEYNTINL